MSACWRKDQEEHGNVFDRTDLLVRFSTADATSTDIAVTVKGFHIDSFHALIDYEVHC
jgi:hypothetical protein